MKKGRTMDFQNRGVRAIAALGLVAILSLALWQAGVLLRDPDEDVEIQDQSGQTVVLEIRAADTGIETPVENGLSVGIVEGRLAPNFEASTLTGERVTLADFRGQAVFLNFWASWCGPCRAEMPDIEAVLRQYENEGLVVLAVNNGESFAPAASFIADLELNLTVVALDPGQDVVRRFRVVSMPTSIFIDARGVITRVHGGLATAEQIDEFVREALGENANAR